MVQWELRASGRVLSMADSQIKNLGFYKPMGSCLENPEGWMQWTQMRKWWAKVWHINHSYPPVTREERTELTYTIHSGQKRPTEWTDFVQTSSTGSSFPAGASLGLHSLLVLHRVFFTCWCFTNFNFKILPWQLNKMVTGHKAHKLGRQSLNDHSCQIWFTFLCMLLRKFNWTIFPL